MTDLEKTIGSLRERFDALRRNFDVELAALAESFAEAESAAGELRVGAEAQDARLQQLEDRAAGQAELIDTLKQEARESRDFQAEVRERDLEIEKLASELETKTELIQALRRQLREVEQLRAAAVRRDTTIAEQQEALEGKQQALDEAQRRIESLGGELETLRAETECRTSDEDAELKALRAELDARRTMIRSLREDAARAGALESQLDAKREAIAEFQDSIEKHVQTIEDLRRSAEAWKKKYEAALGSDRVRDEPETLAEAPLFSETELDALRDLGVENYEATMGRDSDGSTADAGGEPATGGEDGEETAGEEIINDRTVAIDMRDALTQVRAQKSQSG